METGRQINESFEIELPGDNRPITSFSKEYSPIITETNNNQIFYKPNENKYVEIVSFEDKLEKRKITGFQELRINRLINILESKIKTFVWTKKDNEYVKTYRTLNEVKMKLLIENDDFKNSFPVVLRFLAYPMIILSENNDLIISKPGYNENLQSYFTEDCPKINFMDINEAKKIINDIISDFCFKTEQDKIMALSYIITPACRGLYKTITSRTPLFLIKANRERAGKDYLAGVVGIIYEGKAIDDTPFNSGDGQNTEELRKKLTSAIKTGRRRIHSSNNKGFLNNAILEQFLTSETWRDRELGSNTELILNNEIDVSLSANIGITYSADLFNRSRIINLEYYDEDANKRTFKIPDLHGYVKKNRQIILSAIFTIIKKWIDDGMIEYKESIFTSFNEWARIVGNIMIHNDMGNPCISQEDDGIGGDKETSDFKALFELCASLQKENLNYINGYKPSDIMNLIISEQQLESPIFSGWDFNELKVRTKFGISLQKYLNREFSGIKMILKDPNQKRSDRKTYLFINTNKIGGNLGNLGNLSPTVLTFCNDTDIKGTGTVQTLPRLPTLPANCSETKNMAKELEEDLHEIDLILSAKPIGTQK